MRLPTLRIASGFLPINAAACSARAQPSAQDAPPRASMLRNGWTRVLAAGRFVHLPLPAGRVASTKS
ncbi:MAG: hypothetical protein OJF61_002450 [Rhodanobacteraceae bacterium]|jgi:hypothetical protein|nr:MAG: hypothetical protein OJF61_002450 [Rhodanobacteraceae bacterium]